MHRSLRRGSVGIIAITLGMSCPRPQEEEQQATSSSSSEKQAERHEPVQYPPQKGYLAPTNPPEGITSVVSPAEIRQVAPVYAPSVGSSSRLPIRILEIPVVLEQAQEPPESLYPSEPDTPEMPGGGDIGELELDSVRATGPNYVAEANEQGVVFHPLGGGSSLIADPTLAEDSPPELQRRLCVAYDQYDDRFLVVSFQSTLGTSTIVVAVSDDASPVGPWFRFRLLVPGGNDARGGVLERLVIDERYIHLQLKYPVSEQTATDAISVYTIAKGNKGGGLYTGMGARVVQYTPLHKRRKAHSGEG